MLTREQSSAYERMSNIAAGLCADCCKVLQKNEVHVCDKCYQSFIESDPNARLYDEEDPKKV